MAIVQWGGSGNLLCLMTLDSFLGNTLFLTTKFFLVNRKLQRKKKIISLISHDN